VAFPGGGGTEVCLGGERHFGILVKVFGYGSIAWFAAGMHPDL